MHLVVNLAAEPQHLQTLAGHGLMENLLALISVQPQVVKEKTFSLITQILCKLCIYCPALAPRLLQAGAGKVIAAVMGRPAASADGEEQRMHTAGVGVSFSLPPKQLCTLVELMGALMPALPKELFYSKFVKGHSARRHGTVTWEWENEGGDWQPYSPRESASMEAARAGGQQVVLLRSMEHRWLIRFDQMIQMNPTTRRQRAIRRTVQEIAQAPMDPASDPRARFFAAEPEALFGFCQ